MRTYSTTAVARIMENLLRTLEVVFGYGDLPDPETPFISWYIADTAFKIPDDYGGLAVREDTVTVELYTTGKDFALEDALEELIEVFGPRKHEERNYYESVYQITYTFTITTKTRRSTT